MLGFTPLHNQLYGRPASFLGIYSEDQYLDDVAQRAAHDYVAAHARVEAIERERGQYYHHHGSRHHHRGPGHFHHHRHLGHIAADNFHPGFGPFVARRQPSPPHRASIYSVEAAELVYSVLQAQGEERQRGRRGQGEGGERARGHDGGLMRPALKVGGRSLLPSPPLFPPPFGSPPPVLPRL